MDRRAIFAAVRGALSGRAFFFGVLGVFLILLIASAEDIAPAFYLAGLLEEGFHCRMIINALASDSMVLALPILAAVPYAASVVDDMRSGFIKEYLPRTTRGGYIAGKIAACTLSGGLVFVCGIMAAHAVMALAFTPMESAAGISAGLLPEVRELFGEGVLFFCTGAFWAMTGMLAAALTGSKYMAYASPFVIYYVLIILHERYFGAMHILYPREWTAPTEYWMFGGIGAVLFVTELTFIAALCFWIVAKKKLF